MLYYSNAFNVAIAFIVGLILKPVMVYLMLPDEDIVLSAISPIKIDEYWIGSVYLLPIYLILLIGMASVPSKNVTRSKSSRSYRTPRTFKLYPIWMFTFIAIIGLIGFLFQFPEIILTFNKNTIATASLEDYNSGGFWRFLILFSFFSSVLAIYNIGVGRDIKQSAVIFTFNALLTTVFYIISDQRSFIMHSFIVWIAGFYYYTNKLSKKMIVMLIFVPLIVAALLTVNRLSESSSDFSDIAKSVVSNLAGRNGIEHSKTLQIINSVSADLDYRYGSTYIDSLVMLVPRSFIPDSKPVNLDTEVAFKYFGAVEYGSGAIPPGMIGDLFINYAYYGAILGSFVLGCLVGYADSKFDSKNASLLFELYFISSFSTLGSNLLGSGLSSCITSYLLNFIVLSFMYFLCLRKSYGTPSSGSSQIIHV